MAIWQSNWTLGRCCMCWWSSGFCCFVLSFVCLFMQDTITANSSSVDDYQPR